MADDGTERVAERVPLTVRVKPDIVTALNIYSAINDRYIYEVVEDLVEKGLSSVGTSVQSLVALGGTLGAKET